MVPFLVVVVGSVGSCADQAPESDDAAAEAAPMSDGKADAAFAVNFDGMYRAHITSFRAGDIPAMTLDHGTYVRSRCYHSSCSLEVSETDSYDYVTRSGKTYVRFWSFDAWRDSQGTLQQDPRVADTYEIQGTATGIKLRKTYSTRWVTLYPTTSDANCTATGGSLGVNGCTCPGNVSGEWPHNIFVPAAGGCVHNPGSDETNCDDSDGMWTDDDAAANGAFCLCGYGRYLDDTGSCSDL